MVPQPSPILELTIKSLPGIREAYYLCDIVTPQAGTSPTVQWVTIKISNHILDSQFFSTMYNKVDIFRLTQVTLISYAIPINHTKFQFKKLKKI